MRIVMTAAIVSLLPCGFLVAQNAARDSDNSVRRVIRGNYERLFFEKEVSRLAVGDENVLSFELLSTREAIVLGKKIGRTNLIAWYQAGGIVEYRFSVEEDLTLLREALRDIDERVTVEVAPNRPALVLRGRVKDVTVLQQAENAARLYLAAGGSTRRGARRDNARAVAESIAASLRLAAGATPEDTEEGDEPDDSASDEPQQLVAGDGAVINLLKVDSAPLSPEEKVRAAIEPIGGSAVTVRRVLSGSIAAASKDVLILEGKVSDQVTLVRVLSVAARVLTGRSLRNTDGETLIRVLAQEGGGVLDGGGGGRGGRNSGLGSGSGRGGGGGAGGRSGGLGRGGVGVFRGDIQTNVARAKALEVAGGRILSFIEVTDLPLVRVNVQFYEINRTRVLNYSTDWGAFVSDFQQPALRPAAVGPTFQSNPASVGTFSVVDVQNVLSSIGGSLGNQFQLSGDNVAVDTAFRLLEAKGLARRLSSPTLTVLSGETAQLSIGGEIPIQEIFSPSSNSDDAPGIFGSVTFRSFGISLGLRPQVDESDMITLELAPSVSQPDQQLTSVLVDATGSEQPTTAFESRSIQTNSRLRDGQSLMLGGLISRGDSRDISQPPVIGDIPVLGWAFRSFGETDDDRELVILVSPTIVREPRPEVALWKFSGKRELLRSAKLIGDREEKSESP